MRILTWSVDEILSEVKILEDESKELKFQLTKLCWYMRGGLSYDEAYALGPEEREIITRLISDNLDTTKETGMPFF